MFFFQGARGTGKSGRGRGVRCRDPQVRLPALPLSGEEGATLEGCLKNGSSQGQNVPLTVLFVPNSLDSGPTDFICKILRIYRLSFDQNNCTLTLMCLERSFCVVNFLRLSLWIIRVSMLDSCSSAHPPPLRLLQALSLRPLSTLPVDAVVMPNSDH